MIARSFVALIAAAALAAPAFAQNEPSAAPDAHHPGGDWRQARQAHEARKLKALHDMLQIRPDQESAFQAFQTAVQPQPPAEQSQRPERQEMASLTTPERLDRMARMMADHEARRRARFERVSGAVKALYAALTPEQKRAFDALPALVGPEFGLGGGRMGHGGHMMAGGMGRHDGGRPMGPPPPQ
jgi:periplasmic protein CpxP/Spy